MRHVVGRILVIVVLLSTSLTFLSHLPSSKADSVEYTYYLHSEKSFANYFDLKLALPEPNAITVSEDIPFSGEYKLGEGWLQSENHDYARDMRGTWTFTMYVYCDNDVITGQLFARVLDLSGHLNQTTERSPLIGPCSDPSTPKEVVWNAVIDDPEAGNFLTNEPLKVEIWFDAMSGGTTGSVLTPSGETSSQSQIVSGTYLDTQANNEGGNQYEHLREINVGCGTTTKFEVGGEVGTEGKSISGDYTNLLLNDGMHEVIGEDNNPNSLNWTWTIDISPGPGEYSLYLDAVIGTAPSNDDNFTVAYSTTGAFTGEEMEMFVINETWDEDLSDPPSSRYVFPAGVLTGVPTVYVRILDTNESDWPQLKDALMIDRMYVEHVETTSNCSVMEHIWSIDNLPLGFHDLYVNGHRSPSADGDDFLFQYSRDGPTGQYFNAFLLTNTTDEDYYLSKTGIAPGPTTLWVKVEDTDRTPSPIPSYDNLFIDHIYLASSGGGTPYKLHLIVDNSTYQSRIKTVEDATTVDTTKPTSRVLPLPLYSDPTFNIEFSASDAGSGVNHVELWYLLPDDTPVQYPGSFTTSPIQFTAPTDGRYYFYTQAVDNASNYEDPPLTFDAMTIVDTTPPEIVEVKPSSSAKDVSRGAKIMIRFSESMDSESVEDAFQLVEDKSGKRWEASSGSVVWNHPMNTSFTFSLPDGEELKWGTRYTITVNVGAEDLAGNNLQTTFQSHFDTEHEFNPTWLILIIVIAVVLMLALAAYYMFFKKKPKEEEKIDEVVPVQPGEVPVQTSAPVPSPTMVPAPPPVSEQPAHVETGVRPLWESEETPEEMWKEDRANISACITCGRFIPDESTFCPYCGVRRR